MAFSISLARLWWLLRRDVKRGFGASRHYYRTLPLITTWSWPYWSEKPNATPIHVLTGADDWLLAAWMLASWFHFTEQGWQVVIHDDGSLPEAAAKTFLRMWPGARIIPRAEADAVMERALTPFPFCLEFRRAHPLGLRMFDTTYFAQGERLLLVDSDVLFFRPPAEILRWTDASNDECWFNEDVAEGALITASDAETELGVRLWPRVNSGICLLFKPAIDFDFCDRALAQTSILRGHVGQVEQTLFALCASRHGKGGLLPKSYEVSLRKRSARDAIARHYLGAVRDRFYGEGLKRLRDELLIDEE